MIFAFPLPPSVNFYWRLGPHGFYIAKQGIAFRQEVCAIALAAGVRKPLLCRIALDIMVTMPDKRRRDLDNVLKALLDSMAHAGIYRDDEQVDSITIRRGDVIKRKGGCVVLVQKIGEGK